MNKTVRQIVAEAIGRDDFEADDRIIDIIIDYLRDNDFDGLCHPESECGCLLGRHFQPCDGDSIGDCQAGYNIKPQNGSCPCGGHCKLHISTEKDGGEDNGDKD